MDHREYIRVVEGSKNAILFIHGIAGSPAHFRHLLPVIPADWSVHNILLDGHGNSVKDFSVTSIDNWKIQVSNAVDNLLSSHSKIVIAAHSMGTLFAIQEAVYRPDRIAALFLLDVPLCPRVKFSALLNALRLTQGWIPSDHRILNAMLNATSIQLDRRLWKYIGWIPRFIELLREARRTRAVLPSLTVPTQAFQSKHDELVSPRAEKYLNVSPSVEITQLAHSGHYFYPEDDLHFLQEHLQKTVEQF